MMIVLDVVYGSLMWCSAQRNLAKFQEKYGKPQVWQPIMSNPVGAAIMAALCRPLGTFNSSRIVLPNDNLITVGLDIAFSLERQLVGV